MPLWALYKGRFSEEYVYSIMDSLVTTGVFGEEKAPLKKAAGEVMAIDEGGTAIVSINFKKVF